MPNLVGIGNSQVPTNAMLGGLAYQDSVGEINIDKIKARTSDTAADIFVYDTRKDSDGGAWRHRTQNLSWYNEGANAFRGARKEFPAVAVIVSTSSNTIIYDGDDPNLSMWMEFSGSAGWLGGAAPAALSAKNGIITVGSNTTNQRLRLVFLLKDYCEDWAHVGGGGHRASTGNFLGRNSDSSAGRTLDSTIGIVNRTINGVAMTVLPNAPIDASTGLPVPTIAIATDGGTNIINDNGTVTQGYQTIATENVDLHPDGFMTDGISGATNDSFSFYKIGTIARLASYGHRSNVHNITTFLNEGTGECLFEGSGNEIAIAQSEGLLRIEEKYPESFTPGNDALSFGLHNRTTSSYNTGWMHGAIKGAFLSDTDDTNLSGTSLIANGDFSSSSTAAFTTVAGGTAAVVGGLLKLTDTGGAFCYASAPFTTVVGNQYFITADIVNSSNTANANYIRCGNSHNGIDFHNTNYGTGYGTKTFYFTATATTTYLTLISGNGVGEIGHWDNVFAYKLDNDRSVSSKGLQPYGTITKSAVATGAELVAYSGWSSSNYLRQPYNSNLDFGSDDWSFNFWVNPNDSSSGSVLISRWSYNVDSSLAGRIGIYFNSGNVRFDLTDDGASSYQGITGTNGIQDTTGWHMVNILRRGDNAEMWVDGKLDVSAALTSTSNGSYSNSNAILEIGHSPNMGSPDSGIQLALIRISASVPSAEQIKKMYNDEKCLFHENAKCTLYGTSDAVTALAHDDSNNILHVGTSAGRSEFQGLNRINNTTTAVTTAISASNELIAEQ